MTTARPDASTPTIRVEGLDVEFRTEDGAFKAVRNLSFEIRAGETLAVVGESGSGKTTLAGIIAHRVRCDFVRFTAVLSGIREIKQIMAGAERARGYGRHDVSDSVF